METKLQLGRNTNSMKSTRTRQLLSLMNALNNHVSQLLKKDIDPESAFF